MARNGSGVYSKPAGTTAVTGTTIESAKYNSVIDDIETDMNTPRPIVAGGTGSSTAELARTALGLAIGSDVQAYDANLASLSGLTLASDKMLYATAANTLALADLTSFGRSLVDDANAAAARTTLGLGTAATVDTGTANGEIPVMDATGYPAADGSQITNITSPRIGVSQTWQDVSGSRVVNTSYQNTTGKPIMVNVWGSTTAPAYLEVSTDNATWVEVAAGDQGSSIGKATKSAIVPDDHYYRVNGSAYTGWAELR